MKIKLLTIFVIISIFTSHIAGAQDESPVLPSDATPEMIIDVLSTAHERYGSIHVRMVNLHHDSGGKLVHEVWTLRSEGKLRHQRTLYDPEGEITDQSVRIFDGDYVYDSHGLMNRPTVMPAGFSSEQAIFGLGHVSTMIAPVNVANRLSKNLSFVRLMGVETISDRDTMRLELREPEGIDLNLWIDQQSGIILQEQVLWPDGSVFSTTTVELVEFDVPFDAAADFFYVDQDAYNPEALKQFFLPPVATEG